MRVLSRRAIREFSGKYQRAAVPLRAWYKAVTTGTYANFPELKQTFNSVDAVPGKIRTLYVFNIGGNNYRLVADIHFNRQRLYIRFILTHAEYDKGDWKKGH
jgi:mRNA interferase HigB